MPKVTLVKKARKDYPEHNIKKGDSYYWWAFRYSPVQKSKTFPTPSQLTQSEFLLSLYDFQDRIGRLSVETTEDLQSEVEDIINEIESLRDEQEEKRNNMPDQLQESEIGELLQERYEGLDSWISDLQSIDLDYEPDEAQTDEEKAKALQDFINNAIEEIQTTDSGL